MRKLILIIASLLITLNLWSQDEQVNELVRKGVDLHEKGKFQEAINTYKAALVIDEKSPYANYEIAYTYYTLKKFDDCVNHCRIVLAQNKEHLLEAYLILGSALDDLGKPEEAVTVYEEGLLKFPSNYLLYFNLGLTQYLLKKMDQAEENTIKAIRLNKTHASSHMLLAVIMQEKGARAKSILATYYFLMLEPNSDRSVSNYASLQEMLMQGISKTNDKTINVSIPYSSEKDDFGTVDMSISLMAATIYTSTDKKNKKKEIDALAEFTKTVFAICGELKKDQTGFWWDFYVPVFYDLKNSGHCLAFAYYISQSKNSEEVNKWLKKNSKKVKELESWISKQTEE